MFSGDTSPFDGFVEFAQDTDLLVHEAMLADGIDRILERTGMGERLRHHLETSHTYAEDVGRIASDANVKLLALHHLVPGDDPELGEEDWERAVRKTWAGPLLIGSDGLVIELGRDQT